MEGKLHKNISKTTQESGVFVVMGAVWLGVFIMLLALALDTAMIATAKLHQNAVAEYIALGTLKTLKDPPTDGSYSGSPNNSNNEVAQYNFAISRGALAGSATLLGTTGPQLSSPSDLNVRASDGEDEGENCQGGSTGGAGPDGGNHNNNPGSDCPVGSADCEEGDNDWCGFEPTSSAGSAVAGTYTPATGSTPASFVPAPVGNPSAANSVRIKLNLADPSISPMVLPLSKILMGTDSIRFSSSAIAYRDPSGNYQIVR